MAQLTGGVFKKPKIQIRHSPPPVQGPRIPSLVVTVGAATPEQETPQEGERSLPPASKSQTLC